MRRNFIAGIALLNVASAAFAQTVVYSTGFESPAFVPGTIVNQSGWAAELAATTFNAQVQSASVNTGTQALKVTANPTAAAGGWVFYDPLEITPLASNTPLVNAEFSMFIGSSPARSGGWGMDVFSSNLNFMASWQVDLNNRIRAQDGQNGFVVSAGTVSLDAWNTYKLVMDFSTNKYDVLVNGVLFHDNLNITPGNGIIGDFDFRHNQQLPSSDFALFDDLRITVANPPPPPIEWGNPLGGSWNTASDWFGGGVPNSTTAVAILGTAISTPRTISLSAGTVTIDQLQITSPVSYTLSGIVPSNPWTLRFGGASTTALSVAAGTHEFNTDVLIDKDAALDIAAGSGVRFHQKFLAPGRVLTKSGGGTLQVREIRDAAVLVDAGTVQLTAGGTFVGTSVLTAITIAGGTVDVGSSTTGVSSKVLIDYAGASPIETLRTYLAAEWIVDSLNSDARKAIGYAEANVIGLSQLDGTTSSPTAVDSTAVLLVTTFKGDTNLDGTVNLDDFTALAANFGASAAVWSMGDFDYSTTVTLDDFTSLAANFGLTGSEIPRPSEVPEPGPVSILVAGSYFLRRRRAN